MTRIMVRRSTTFRLVAAAFAVAVATFAFAVGGAVGGVALAVAVAVATFATFAFAESLGSDRAVKAERDRLRELMGSTPPPPPRVEPSMGGGGLDEEAADGLAAKDLYRREGPWPPPAWHPEGTAHSPAAEAAERFAPLLIEYYAYGLVQARRHSVISLVMSILGGMVILAGVSMLIFRVQTGADVAGSAVATAAGVLTNGIAVLFHRQSNQALRHMQDQTLTLRDDMKQERDAYQALIQLDKIDGIQLRDRLRAGLVLRLSGAELPSLDEEKRPPIDLRSPVEGHGVVGTTPKAPPQRQ